ncbi:MAG: DUF4160 domain-containing protein [Gemmatimonadaceae bacterium]
MGRRRLVSSRMPTISAFDGVVIRMYRSDHAPPHFHAIYSGEEATIDIHTLQISRGTLPRRALALTLEWAAVHRTALLEDWNLCAMSEIPKTIPPLD